MCPVAHSTSSLQTEDTSLWRMSAMWKVRRGTNPCHSVTFGALLLTYTLCCCPAGSSLMKVAVKKDGHHFCTHINQVVGEPDFTGKDANG